MAKDEAPGVPRRSLPDCEPRPTTIHRTTVGTARVARTAGIGGTVTSAAILLFTLATLPSAAATDRAAAGDARAAAATADTAAPVPAPAATTATAGARQSTVPATPWMPEDWRQLERSIGYEELATFLASIDGQSGVTVSAAGTTTEGRTVFLVHVSARGGAAGGAARANTGGEPAPASAAASATATATRRILFYAQQHGDEVAGKDALLYLLRDLVRRPELLPADAELWILPMMNPDGAVAGTRESGAGVDLNRDHLGLEQPETRALHAVMQRVRPHVAVDCHEFLRDPAAWRARGLEKWPLITMDGMNNPLLDPDLLAIARRWVDEAQGVANAAGHDYLRYWVGGVPPDDELRHSAPDIDSAMNALATYGGLSFIIEAAVRDGDAANRDLGARVDAYLALLGAFVAGGSQPAADLAAFERARERARTEAPTAFVPTNYLWVNPGAVVTPFPVRELASGRRFEVPTPNLMTTLAVKRSVPAPTAYAVEPAAADAVAALLGRHAIPFERLAAPRQVTVEVATLLGVEDDFDAVYSRYEGRQIVTRGAATERTLAAGSLWIPLTGEAAVRTALLLEPTALYGLYQLPTFRALVGAGGELPVLRALSAVADGAAP